MTAWAIETLVATSLLMLLVRMLTQQALEDCFRYQHFAADDTGRLVLNPGSVGCPRYADNEDRLVNEAGSPHARYAIATRRASSSPPTASRPGSSRRGRTRS